MSKSTFSKLNAINNAIFIVFLALLGFQAATGQVPIRSSAKWSVPQIARTLGNGSLASPDSVTFRVSRTMSNVDLVASAELASYVAISPASFSQLQPGVDYTVNFSYSIPSTATQGVKHGRVYLQLGTRTLGKSLPFQLTIDYGTNVVAPTALTLSRPSLGLVAGIAPSGNGITFSSSSPEIASITAGRILAIPPTTNAPNGFFGKVVSTSESGGQITVTTVPAPLSDAFSRASVRLNQPLLPSQMSSNVALRDGVSIAENDPRSPNAANEFNYVLNDVSLGPFKVNGSLTLQPEMHFDFDFDGLSLTQLAYTIDLQQTSNLNLTLVLASASVDDEVELVRVVGTPIVVYVGFFPVVIIPETSIVLSGEGSVAANVTYKVDQAANLRLGFGYSNGSWSPIVSHSSSRTATPPTGVNLTMNLKAELGPRFSARLYGVVGPHVDLTGFAELDVDSSRIPRWQVWAGLEASAAISLDRIDDDLDDIEFPFLLQNRFLVLEGGGDGRITGQVRDAVTNATLPNSVVTVYKDGLVDGTSLTNGSGQFDVEANAGPVYRIDITRSGYLPASYQNIVIAEGETRTLEVILQIDNANAGNGNVSGAVVNSVTGSGVPGLTVNLRSGINATTGPIVRTTSTGAGGAYAVSALPAGNYTAEATGTGYNPTYFTVLCIGNTTRPNQNGVITPTLPAGQVRIVLTWGAVPSDLDSHFFGPLAAGGRFHVYYNNPTVSGVAELDLDDVTSFGPETTTLLQQIGGIYRFMVHDYTNLSSSTSSALSNSGAQVRVYRGSALIGNFNVPLGQPATLWTVFELEGTTLRPINQMGFSGVPQTGRGLDDLGDLSEKNTLSRTSMGEFNPKVSQSRQDLLTPRLNPGYNTPYGAGCAPIPFSNPAPITIADNTISTPYGSPIAVSGLTGSISNIELKLNGFSHTFPDDVGMVLVGPTGTAYLVQDGATDHLIGNPAANITYTISDVGAAAIPDTEPLTSGAIYQPANYYAGDMFVAPGPLGTYQSPSSMMTLASTFGGTAPNGSWRLFVVDFADGDVGNITGGWSLNITPTSCTGGGVEGDVVDGGGSNVGDGFILANDVATIRQFVLNGGVPASATNQFQRADVNLPCGNGLIDSGDVTVIRQMALGNFSSNTPACGPTGPSGSAQGNMSPDYRSNAPGSMTWNYGSNRTNY